MTELINLHNWVFQKAKITIAATESAISAFCKSHKCKLIPNGTKKLVWLLISNINIKKVRVEEMPEDLAFLMPFFMRQNIIQNFRSKFSWSLYVITLTWKFPIIFLPIIIQNYDVWFALVSNFLHWCYTSTLLSTNQNRVNFFWKYNARVNNNRTVSFSKSSLFSSLCICWSDPTRLRYFWFVRWPFLTF